MLSWVSAPAELNPSQNRVEEFFIGRLLRHLPANIRPLLLADRGFGRASLLRFVQQMPNHTGYPVDYVIRLRGDPVSGRGQAMVSGHIALRSAPGGADAAGAVLQGRQATLRTERSTVTATHRLLVALLLACCLLILAGVRASASLSFRRLVCSRGKWGILNLGYEYYLATPDPPPQLFTIQHHQTGYA